jgi:glycosyltransferase involved in cell wall biosynthesis
VQEIASKLVEWLTLPAEERERAGAALAATSAERFGWERVAQGVIAAAEGRLDELPVPTAESRPPLG